MNGSGLYQKTQKTKPTSTHTQKLHIRTRCSIYIRSRLLRDIRHSTCPCPMPPLSAGRGAQLTRKQEAQLSSQEAHLHSAVAGAGACADATGDASANGTHGARKEPPDWRPLQRRWLVLWGGVYMSCFFKLPIHTDKFYFETSMRLLCPERTTTPMGPSRKVPALQIRGGTSSHEEGQPY